MSYVVVYETPVRRLRTSGLPHPSRQEALEAVGRAKQVGYLKPLYLLRVTKRPAEVEP
jgi:hypothetical protein